MALFTPDEWSFSEKALELVTTNPFHPTWAEGEAEILGLPLRDLPTGIAWSPGAQLWGPQSVYSEEFDQRITEMVECLRRRLEAGESANEGELGRYELLSYYRLYCKCGRELDRCINAAVRGDGKGWGDDCAPEENERPPDGKALWTEFHREHEHLLRLDGRDFPLKYKAEHIFACFFVFRRAFYHIFFNIVGTSKSVAKLRSAVWESIVTHDLLGWMQGQYERMKGIPTLITGPSGTGKERVAEAIGRSLYIPFDPKKKVFRIDFLKAFKPINLAALPPSLIESELFGTVKGAFNDAIDRVGRLEECPNDGAMFLDEIGEVTWNIQVKLLRVLNERRFQRVGENEDKVFGGKVIAATNRDLAAAMQAGHIREDFYYRLCADKIETPSLREQLADCPDDFTLMVEHACRTVVGEEKASRLAQEVVGWVERNLPGHTWPGNFRELEQCVRSYTIRKEYHPAQSARSRVAECPPQRACDPIGEACETLATAVLQLKVTCADEIELKKKRIFDQVKRRLFTLVRARTRTKQEAATLLGIDVRTLDAGMRVTDCHPVDG
jgi:DNA-binding NtrC family response regulator